MFEKMVMIHNYSNLAEVRPDKDNSSRNFISEEGHFVKYKPERSYQKTMREYRNLILWKDLLDLYQEEGLPLNSPAPVGLSERGCIFMEYLEGINGKQMSNCKKRTMIGDENPVNLHEDFIEKIACLCKIKEINNLSHGDFDIRHLIYNPHERTLSVIDVENSCIDANEASSETSKIKRQLSRFKSHIKPRAVDGIFNEIYSSCKLEPKIDEVINNIGLVFPNTTYDNDLYPIPPYI